MTIAVNDRYEVCELIGTGAFGRVYSARDQVTGDHVALKVLELGETDESSEQGDRVRATRDPDGKGEFRRHGEVERLRAEFECLSRLSHPNLLRVSDLGVCNRTVVEPSIPRGAIFFTSELIAGVELGAWGRSGPSEPEILSRLAELADALARVHEIAVVHCDVKPSNILISPERGAVLLDLGLSLRGGSRGDARGTLPYMDERALAGAPDAQSDLHALGVSFFRVLAGTLPFPADSPRALVGALASTRRPSLRDHRADLSRLLADLIDNLIVPELRPRSASDLLERIWTAREALGESIKRPRRRRGKAGAARLVGRDELVNRAAAHVRFDATRAPALVALTGRGGVGCGAVAEEIARGAQISAIGSGASLEVLRGNGSRIVDELCPALAVATLEGRARVAASADIVIATLAERAGRQPVLWVFDRDHDDERASEVVRALALGHPGLANAPATLIGNFGDLLKDREEECVVEIEVEPLSAEAVAELAAALLSERPPAAWLRELTVHCLGRPRILSEALSRAAERSEPLTEIDPASLVSREEAASIDAHLDAGARRFSEFERHCMAALAIADDGLSAPTIARLLESPLSTVYSAIGTLARHDWIREASALWEPLSSAHAGAGERAIPARLRRELHAKVLEDGAAHDSLSPAAKARHLAVTGPSREALESLAAAARWHFERGELNKARASAVEVIERAEGGDLSSAHLLAAEIDFEAANYPDAVRSAERAARARDRTKQRSALLLCARAKQRAGDSSGAQRELEALLRKEPGDLSARGELARIFLFRGKHEAAAEHAGSISSLADTSSDGAQLCLEAAGLVALYKGDRGGAEACFGRLREIAVAGSNDRLGGRASALLGLAAHHSGDVVAAAENYREAARLARRTGQIHALASAEINRATVEADRGRFASALSSLDAAIVSLRRLGNVVELIAALYNRAHCLFALGDLAAAEATAKRVLELAREADRPQFELYGHLVIGDVARREGSLKQARAAYEAARSVAARATSSIETTTVELNLAELAAEVGDRAALEHLERAKAAGSGDDGRILLSRARVSLSLGVADPALLAALEPAAETARRQGREDLSWRLASLAARLASAAGARDRARANAATALAEFGRIVAAAPADRRVPMRRDPDAAGLDALGASLELSALRDPIEPQAKSFDVLRRLLALSSRLNSELRLEPLLDQVIDTAIELSGAERGFLLLRAAGGLEVGVARNIDQRGLSTSGEVAVSRSIAERAAESGEIVLSVDAAFDHRFGASESVASMRLRSVLAIPLRFRSELIGTIYLDHRFRSGAFDDHAVHLVRELANIAGVAIGNARITAENRDRATEISALNRQLEEELGDRESELASIRSRIPPGDALGAGEEIVGASPAVRALHSLIERMASSGLPVVVTGESGSGKELVARALHRLSPRRRGPFIAVNCGAVAESLLESELFGHVRGAFTGAERTRRGHFELADGGTLFLDEIADTSPAMQAKLLRVLQEGELRRLGDEEVRRVDVRVVAATNKDLRDLTDAGKFREDLFFRLNVLAIRVPPLRDRAGDVALLAAHLLARSSMQPAPTLSREALAALGRYSWPGNVRELENELARASAIADGVIGREHLSPHVQAAEHKVGNEADELDLKSRVEALERELISAALEQCGGNQTRAAKVLGLSRYGLQKKLKRYG